MDFASKLLVFILSERASRTERPSVRDVDDLRTRSRRLSGLLADSPGAFREFDDDD